MMDQLSQQAYQFYQNGDFSQAQLLYEKAIENNPENTTNYWYLGLIKILLGDELEAQSTWFSVLMEGEEDQSILWVNELVEILEKEIDNRINLGDAQTVWVLRQHLREIKPDNLNNLLHLVTSTLEIELFTEAEDLIKSLIEQWPSLEILERDFELICSNLEQILLIFSTEEISNHFLMICCDYGKVNPSFAQYLINYCLQKLIQVSLNQFLRLRFTEIIYLFKPEDLNIISELIAVYQGEKLYQKSFELSEKMINLADNLPDKISAYYQFLRGLLKQGIAIEKAKNIKKNLEDALQSLQSSNITLENKYLINLIGTTSCFHYLEDNPKDLHLFRGKISQFYQKQIQENFAHHYPDYQSSQKSLKSSENKPIKIGYLSAFFKRHSISHLLKTTLKYHDREKFEVYTYSLYQCADDLQQWIKNNSNFRDISPTDLVTKPIEQIKTMWETINQDELDILVDLDSLTTMETCAIMALKPAPIQVTWLGFDTSDLPAIDYFIADPYVLPENAQDYYQSKIWRLPHTYIGLEGFEVGNPTLRRDELNIPEDAVIYFSSQTGFKRNPENISAQFKILREVENSYFLLKTVGVDIAETQAFFEKIAKSEGVSPDRLRFLPVVSYEEIHRANLAIADVVLDTYPYNGATTTLETLWLEIPIVTLVGEQFAARNSYTFLKNIGVTEGIAWNQEEYIQWGIKLGKDEKLRQEVAWKIRQSKFNSPLWYGKEFVKELEKAYQQMRKI
jgi:predicted O-linked N-acetylglucosamine transferase (SPINDLY family)